MLVDSRPRPSIIAIIDNFSRFLMLFPAKDASAASAAKAILYCTGIFGVPSQLMRRTPSWSDPIKRLYVTYCTAYI